MGYIRVHCEEDDHYVLTEIKYLPEEVEVNDYIELFCPVCGQKRLCKVVSKA